MEILVENVAALEAAMPQVFEALAGRRKIALYGEMGAGKTTFTALFCKHLGVQDSTASPTFSLINEYAYRDPQGRTALVHHLDLYRLKSAQEAFDIGIEEILDDPWYCLIEWPQLVAPLLPPGKAKIEIEILDKTRRRVLIL